MLFALRNIYWDWGIGCHASLTHMGYDQILLTNAMKYYGDFIFIAKLAKQKIKQKLSTCN